MIVRAAVILWAAITQLDYRKRYNYWDTACGMSSSITHYFTAAIEQEIHSYSLGV